MATANFNWGEVSASQNQKEVTINDTFNKIEDSLSENEAILIGVTNAHSFTNAEFRENFFLEFDDDPTPPTALITITVPAIKRGLFKIVNNTSFDMNVEITSQPGPIPSIASGASAIMSCDAINVIEESGSRLTDATAPVERFKFIPVGGHIIPTATGGCAALTTIASAADQPDLTSLNFDATTAEHAQLKHIFDEVGHAGNVSMQFLTSQTGAATFGVAWNAKIVGLSDDQTFLSNFGISRLALSTLTTADDLYLSEKTGFIKTVAPAAGDMSVIDIFRDPTLTPDDLDVDARLHGIVLHYWENQPLDPEWSNVELLFGADGVDADATVDDESDAQHVATYAGTAQCDTSQSQFSKASLLLDGTGDYVTFADEADFDLGAGNFCIEGWFRWNTNPSALQQLAGKYQSASDLRSYSIYHDGASNELKFFVSSDGSTTLAKATFSFTPTLATWYHIVGDYDGTTYRMFLDGVLIDSDVSSETLFNSSADFSIGAQADGVFPFDGWCDDVRLTKESRYVKAFDVPSAPFPRA